MYPDGLVEVGGQCPRAGFDLEFLVPLGLAGARRGRGRRGRRRPLPRHSQPVGHGDLRGVGEDHIASGEETCGGEREKQQQSNV